MQTTPPAEPGVGGVPVVGVGASAGGLDAFARFLKSLPPDTGCAFVLVQHLDATHPSSLSAILDRATAMPVADATDNVPVAANHVYVIPPNTELTIVDRVLRLAPRGPAMPHLPIDRFLHSLAAARGRGAIGVILSGNGSDGTAGLVAVRDAGGTTFAQDPASAEFPSMPAAAVAAGAADVILPPEGIAAEVARIAAHPRFQGSPVAAAEPAGEADLAARLRAVCDVMHDATGIDFSLYRETTVHRRILRRLAIRGVDDLGEYAKLLAGDADERAALERDLLIGVTSFFRDPESFETLQQQVFPAIVQGRPANSAIRIWVPGCATGEEAYSILIALQEYQRDAHTEFPVQLFASDVSEAALERARSATYPASIAAEVSPERLRRFFFGVDGGYRVSKDLRELCVFSRHNLLDDPPFSKLDLISCRNVLIYLEAVQRTIVSLFHYALVDNGFLMLGRSETTHHADLFAAVDGGQRIYMRKRVSRKPYASFARTRTVHRAGDGRGLPVALPRPKVAADLSRKADRVLLSKYSPSGVLVDSSLEVLEIRGQTSPFLALTSGKASFHLLKLLPDTGVFLEVEKLTREAAQTGQPARRDRFPVQLDGHPGEVNLEVTPLKSKEQAAYLVLFESVASATADTPQRKAPAPAASRTDADLREAHVARLTQELQDVRARLVSLVDEHEASDEESQQIAEDAMSANEELQSLTEELETAKEELQSTNEELLSVNRELESRNMRLLSARDLAKSIVETVGVPLVVVDRDLVVRHLNAAFGRTFQVTPGEAGGLPFRELCGGAWDLPVLGDALDGLRDHGTPFDHVQLEGEFPAIGPRALVLGGSVLQGLDMMLLAVEDVTRVRAAEEALRRSEEYRRQSEKMETIGRLAGGIAHDFNNLLTVIIGNAELVSDTLGHAHAVSDNVSEISRAAERAAALTDQLLSFSRRKVLQPRVFDLSPIVADFERMLRRVLSEQIAILLRLAAEPCLVKADPAEIGRVLMNLCLNARDAMPVGGVLTIETTHVTLDAGEENPGGLPAGRYVQLLVGDTGLGMDAETVRHVFEPFYTTKDVGRGVGLGLATVMGVVQESGGTVGCDSAPGEGARFTVLLPEAIADPEAAVPSSDLPAHAPAGSREVVLVVEHDDGVRGLTRAVLVRLGYVVIEAHSGREGLAVVQSHTGPIDLLVTDVLTPEMSGDVLAERAAAVRPSMRVLFVSAHHEGLVAGAVRGAALLQKPYTPGELARKVREVLDQKRDETP